MRYKVAFALIAVFAMSGFAHADSFVLSSSRACPVFSCNTSPVATGTLASPAVSSAQDTESGTGSAAASMTTGFGFFKGSASVDLDRNIGGFSIDNIADAKGDWVDTFSLSGTGSGTLVIPFRLTGSVDSSYSFTDLGGGVTPSVMTQLAFGFYFWSVKNDGVIVGDGSADIKDANGVSKSQFTWQSPGAVDETLYIYIPVLLGADHTNRFDIRFELLAETQFQNFGTGAFGNLKTSALADFSDTGVLQPAKLYDANGNLITATIASESGFDYVGAPPVASVPESSSLSGLACGFLLLGLLARLRAAKSPA
jgi:hypothetical protein